jgi:hypothetical protein
LPIIELDSLEQVPEELRPIAQTTAEGKYAVNVVPTEKLTEFREKNISLMKDQQTLTTVVDRFKAIHNIQDGQLNLDEVESQVTAMREIQQRVQNKQLVDDSGVEELLQRRTSSLKEEMGRKLEAESSEKQKLAAELTKAQARMQDFILESAVTQAVTDPRSKANPSALPDILSRARRAFEVDMNTGSVVVKKDGNVVYGPDAITPMTPVQWIDTVVSESPYLSKDSIGIGSGGGGEGNQTIAAAGAVDMKTYYDKRKREMQAQSSNRR